MMVEAQYLQLSPEGYFRMFEHFKSSGISSEIAFMKVNDYCELKGYSPRYQGFEAFKAAYYRRIKKNFRK
jgi:hypothetical protein